MVSVVRVREVYPLFSCLPPSAVLDGRVGGVGGEVVAGQRLGGHEGAGGGEERVPRGWGGLAGDVAGSHRVRWRLWGAYGGEVRPQVGTRCLGETPPPLPAPQSSTPNLETPPGNIEELLVERLPTSGLQMFRQRGRQPPGHHGILPPTPQVHTGNRHLTKCITFSIITVQIYPGIVHSKHPYCHPHMFL